MNNIPQRIDKYELQELLGQGSMAEVWKALDIQLHRYVAIKILHMNLHDDPSFIGRFEREARLIASLHHPNIVQVHDFQVVPTEAGGSIAYMVMDYVEGQTLAQFIESTSKHGHIPYPEEIVQIFSSICLAVDYAHQKGMIHRDLKPANILLDKHNTTNNPVGEPILTDFGVAKLLGTASGTFTSTQIGTPLYISPEQVNGYAGNERSDIYSLGVMLYEMLTGSTPFQGDDPTAVMTQHLSAKPPQPRTLNPNIPPSLEAVILRSLAKDPAARFNSASSFASAVAEGLNLPIPERLGKPSYPAGVVDMPTYLTTLPSVKPQVSMSSPSQAGLKTPTPLPSTSLTPQPTPSPGDGQRTPTPITSAHPATTPSLYASPQSTPVMPTPTTAMPSTATAPSGASATPVQTPSTTVPSASPPKSTRPRRGLFYGLIALAIILVGGILGAFFLLLHPASTTPVGTGPIVGHAFYVSSGQLHDQEQGIADKLQVDIQNVQAPPSGKSYYLWLLGDKDMTPKKDLLKPAPIKPPLLLSNNLPVQNNAIHYTYQGDAEHNDLLSATSRLLITLDDAGKTPAQPSSNSSTWKYYAQLPQEYIPQDPVNLRGLDHIRHLYYNENHLTVLALYGGLDVWIFRNTEKILEWSTSARDDFNGSTSNYMLMHNLFISILDYLDGVPNVHIDLPADSPIVADPSIARVSLLTVDPSKQGQPQFLDTDPPGDLDHITLHLSEVSKAPDASPQMRQHAMNVVAAVGNAEKWLQQVRTDAKKLVAMTPAELAQPAAQGLLEDMVTQATYAYIGKLDPGTNTVVPGILQAHYEIQKLAAYDITTNVPKSL